MKNLYAVAVVAFCTSSAAVAGTMTYVGPVVPGSDVEIVLPSKSFVERTDEGKFLFDGQALEAFCSEPAQGSFFPAEYTRTEWSDGSLAYQMSGRLFGLYYSTYKFDSVGTAAMQSVLWEILEDTNNLNLANGNFSFGAATDARVVTLATSMLGAVRTAANSAAYKLFNLRSATSQDLLQVVPTAVPLPSSMALLGLGLIGMLRLCNQRKASSN